MVPLLTIVDLSFSGPVLSLSQLWFGGCSQDALQTASEADPQDQCTNTRWEMQVLKKMVSRKMRFFFQPSVKPYGNVTSHIFSFCFGGMIYVFRHRFFLLGRCRMECTQPLDGPFFW